MVDRSAVLAELGIATVPSRWNIFDQVLNLCGKEKLRVAETGSAVDTGNGLSTLYWLIDPRVEFVYSVDLTDFFKRKFGPTLDKFALWDKLKWVRTHSLAALASIPPNSIDLLYLDSDADPRLTLYEFIVGYNKLRPSGWVLCDDKDTKCGELIRLISGASIKCGYDDYGCYKLVKPVQPIHEARPHTTCGMIWFPNPGTENPDNMFVREGGIWL